MKHTPGPWWVRVMKKGVKVVDCFVAAKDVNGFAYNAEILGDDEYRDNIDRKIADARMTAAAPDMYRYAKEVMSHLNTYGPSGVAYLMDSDNNPGQRLRDALKKAEEGELHETHR